MNTNLFRSIGISNFGVAELEILLASAKVKPAANQVCILGLILPIIILRADTAPIIPNAIIRHLHDCNALAAPLLNFHVSVLCVAVDSLPSVRLRTTSSDS